MSRQGGKFKSIKKGEASCSARGFVSGLSEFRNTEDEESQSLVELVVSGMTAGSMAMKPW